MSLRRWRTVLVGMGKVGARYADDERARRWYRYASHAQVLADHPAYAWGAVVDPQPDARTLATDRWAVPLVAAAIDDQVRDFAPEVAILATPPANRLQIVTALPSLRAVIVEKPIDVDFAAARAFAAYCAKRGILVQVNLWRRCDRLFRELADGLLRQRIGIPRAAFALYGNGLLNNGTHVVDFVRMLLGEVVTVRALGQPVRRSGLPLPSDVDVPFWLSLSNGSGVSAHVLDFAEYREVGLDIWGASGRCTILNEGLTVTLRPRSPNRAVSGAEEIDDAAVENLSSTVGMALYELYDNLALALSGGQPLYSPIESALVTAAVIDAVHRSADTGGADVKIGDSSS